MNDFILFISYNCMHQYILKRKCKYNYINDNLITLFKNMKWLWLIFMQPWRLICSLRIRD